MKIKSESRSRSRSRSRSMIVPPLRVGMPGRTLRVQVDAERQ